MKPILTIDFETDPFKHGNRVEPFCCGLYDGKNFTSIWSPKCPEILVGILGKLEPSIIYMHNGGRFDIFFLWKWLGAQMTIISGRIVKATLGQHELRDSYAILPMPLSAYKKDDIDIDKMHRDCRESHKPEILKYLMGDCVYLHELVSGFREEFGDYLTVGSAAMAQLRKFHPFDPGNKYLDELFRSQFFFGGRVQCFQSGEIDKPFKIHDVNSMYPFVMKNYRHPLSKTFAYAKSVGAKTGFVVAEGYNRGAFPLRKKDGGIDFTTKRGQFACTIHEWNVAEQAGMFRATKILKCYNFDEWITFEGFVDHFYDARKKAKKMGDKIREIFYKFILNSAYGKFAQNPDNFNDWCVTRGERMPEPWGEHTIYNEGEFIIWKKPVVRHSYYNVAIGASITGAARGVLLDAIHRAKGLIYCDTDSIVSEELTGVPISGSELGSWKLEAVGDKMAIAGKKLYACMDGAINGPFEETDYEGFKLQCIKSATKGARIPPSDIVEVARGGTVVFRKDAPTFRLNGAGWAGEASKKDFIVREIRKTV